MKVIFRIEGGLTNPPHYEVETNTTVVSNTIQRTYDYVFSHWGIGEEMIELCCKIAMKKVSDHIDAQTEFAKMILDSKAYNRERAFKENRPLKESQYTVEDIEHMMAFPSAYNLTPYKDLFNRPIVQDDSFVLRDVADRNHILKKWRFDKISIISSPKKLKANEQS